MVNSQAYPGERAPQLDEFTPAAEAIKHARKYPRNVHQVLAPCIRPDRHWPFQKPLRLPSLHGDLRNIKGCSKSTTAHDMLKYFNAHFAKALTVVPILMVHPTPGKQVTTARRLQPLHSIAPELHHSTIGHSIALSASSSAS